MTTRTILRKQQIEKRAIQKGDHHHGVWRPGHRPGRQDPRQAAALGDHMQSTLVQAYGPEARGGACSAQVIISEHPIHYPYVRKPDILVCMSQAGFDKYIAELKEDGTLITDQDLVQPPRLEQDYFTIPATRMAEELGRKMMANIIMIGFLHRGHGSRVPRCGPRGTCSTPFPRGPSN